MQTKYLTRKRSLILGGFLTVAFTAAAFAFWTTGGSGTGTAATGSAASSAFAFSGGSIQTAPSGLAPGAGAKALSGTVTNNGDETYQLSTVSVTISSVTKADGVTGECGVSDYKLVDAAGAPSWVVTENASVATLSPAASLDADDTYDFSGVGIEFNNKSDSNQNACQGATVNLAYAAA